MSYAHNAVKLVPLNTDGKTAVQAQDGRELAVFPDYGAALDYCGRVGYPTIPDGTPTQVAPGGEAGNERQDVASPQPVEGASRLQVAPFERKPAQHMLDLATELEGIVAQLRAGQVLGVAYVAQHLEPGSAGRTETNFGWEEQPVIMVGGVEVLKSRILNFVFQSKPAE